MEPLGKVTFDFKQGRIKLGRVWVKTQTITRKDKVRLKEASNIPARTEKVAVVRCSKSFSLLTMDFEPHRIPGLPGVFVTKARVIPNVN